MWNSMALSCHHSVAGCGWKQPSADVLGSGEYIESAAPDGRQGVVL